MSTSRQIIITDTGVDAQNTDTPSGQLHALVANMIVEQKSSLTIESIKSRMTQDLREETAAYKELRDELKYHEEEAIRLRSELEKGDKVIKCWEEIVRDAETLIKSAIQNGTMAYVE